ncbi:MAG: hypothetical protein P8Y80_09860 [Acidobacteriota bacterium]|jgi:hypothetical protein
MSNSYLQKQKCYPFIIHAAPHWGNEPLFPTHTHGLTEIGMPEFIMDPLAFGGPGNGARINYSFDYFMNPKNNNELQEVLNDKVIKLQAAKLSSNLKGESYTYCFREVPATFEAVNQAYVIPGPGIKPGMRFIQIWVDGDDYALTDEYYRGGVTW